MDGIAVHRVELHFLAVEERGFRRHRARGDHVTIREDEPAFGIDDEARRLRGGIPFRVEGARLVDLDGDHAFGHACERAAPRGAFTFGLGQRRLRGLRLQHHLWRGVLRRRLLREGRSQEDQANEQQTWVHAGSFRRVRHSAPENQNPDHRQQEQ
jgi:hypothetical protein